MAESIDGVDELNNRIAELNETLNNFSSSLQSQMRSNSQTVGESTARISQNNAAVSNSTRLSEIQDQVDQRLAAKKQEREANYSTALSATAYSIRSFGTAIVSAEQGLKKYGQSIERAGDAVYSIGQNFGLLGGAVGGLIKFISTFASTALGAVDTLVDFRDEVSKTSGAIPTTLRGIQSLGMQAGYSGDRLQVLQRITVGLGTSLQGLGGVAGTGVIKFMQLAEVSKDVRDRFGRMGVDQERLTDLQAKYVQMQAASGMQYQLQNKSMSQLRRESLDYADNMTRLSALTGKQADTLQQEQEQVQMEFEEQAAMMADQARIRELRARTGDKAAQDEADQLERTMNARKAVQNSLTSLLGPELSSQMSRVFRTGFFDSKSGPLAQIMPELVGYSERLRNIQPGEDAESITREIFDTVKRKYEEGAITFETVLQVMGEEGARALGYNAETFRKLNSYAGKEYDQLIADTEKNIQASLEEDKTAKQVQELRQQEIVLQAEFQKALVPLANVLMPMITSTMGAISASFETVLKPLLLNLGTVLGSVFEQVSVWLSDPNLMSNIKKGFDDVGKALTWLNENKVWIGFGLAMIALIGIAGKLAIAFTALRGAVRLGGGGGGLGAANDNMPGRGGRGGRVGGLLRGGARLLGKVALPLAGAMAAYDAYQGFNADPNASFGGRMANAGRGALSGLTFGLSEHLTGRVTTGTPEAENAEAIAQHSEQVVTDTQQRKENIEQNITLAKNTKEQMTEQTELFDLLTKAIKETTSKFLPFKMSIEDITTQIGTNIMTLQQQLPSGLGGTAQILATIRQRESGGNYQARTRIPGQTASGAYQFTNSTWQSLTRKYGIGEIFRTAAEAPPEIQDAIASKYVEDILQEAGGDVSKVPLKWYTGNIQGNLSARAIALNNGLTPQMYQQRWMTDYSRMGANMGAGMGPGMGNSDIVSVGQQLQSLGLRVSEHPSFGGVRSKHEGKGHREGRAIDVNVGYGNKEANDPAMGAQFDTIANQLRRQGLTVLWRTGGHHDHMHVESKKRPSAARGGIFSGPNSGYPVEMHGTEMIAPLNVNSILMKLAKTPAGTAESTAALNSVMQSGSTSSIDVEKIVSAQVRMIEVLSSKLDSVIDVLESVDNTQTKILRQATV